MSLFRNVTSFSKLVQLGTRMANTSNAELWKNSATLILVTPGEALHSEFAQVHARQQNEQTSPIVHSVQEENSHVLKPNAQMPSNPKSDFKSDYSVLLLERSSKTKFMPNRNVFPGGISDVADFSPAWRGVFAQAGFKNNLTNAQDFGLHRTTISPPLYQRTLDNDYITSEVAFRICAIRETFEECGILLVRDVSSVTGALTSLRTKIHYILSSEELDQWRSRVDKNANEFINLCTTLNVVPDIWALKEWSNWLTPTHLTGEHGRRYDTVFYICSLDSLPDVSHCTREMTSAIWWTPGQALHEHFAGTLSLAPPQIYELSRLRQFHQLRGLEEFAESRSYLGLDRWLPVRIQCKDGFLAVLPGDELYPWEPDLTGENGLIKLDCTVDEAIPDSRPRNVSYYKKGSGVKVKCNIKHNYGHVGPYIDNVMSKL